MKKLSLNEPDGTHQAVNPDLGKAAPVSGGEGRLRFSLAHIASPVFRILPPGFHLMYDF